MTVEYQVAWRRTAWKATTWPRRKLYRSWSAAVAQAKKLEDNQHKYGPVEITIQQRTCGPWGPTVWSVDLEQFVGEEEDE